MPIYSHRCECGDTVVDNLYRNAEECPDEFENKCDMCQKDPAKFKKVITGSGGFRLSGKGVYKPTSKFD